MTETPKNTETAGVRERIVRAAEAQFAAKGYAGTSLREVAATAGVTKPMVYYYFGNKEGLFRALLDGAYAELHQALQNILNAPLNARAKLITVANLHVELNTRRQQTVHFVTSVAMRPPSEEVAVNLGRFKIVLVQAIRSILDEGVAAGEVRPVSLDIAAEMVAAALGSFCCHSIHPSGGAHADLAERTVALFWQGLSRGGERTS